MPIKYNTHDFVEISNDKHNYKYDYSLVEYVNNYTEVTIICPKHGSFKQRPDVHFRGGGCVKCIHSERSEKLNDGKVTFIKKAKDIHGNKYDYNLVEYVNNKTKIKIICPIHGIFEQQPRSHTLNGSGCPYCANKHITNERFMEKCRNKYGNLYNYNKTNYIKSHDKVIVICDNNHEFKVSPNNHLNGRGCPVCKESVGERIIRAYLDEIGVKYIKDMSFDGCIHKRKLKFDFYLPKYDTCVEFDGEQHFNTYRFEKSEDNLNLRIKRDKIKNKFCAENDIKLIRIKYDKSDKEIKSIINRILI